MKSYERTTQADAKKRWSVWSLSNKKAKMCFSQSVAIYCYNKGVGTIAHGSYWPYASRKLVRIKVHLCMLDDYSWCTWLDFLKEESEAFGAFKKLCTQNFRMRRIVRLERLLES